MIKVFLESLYTKNRSLWDKVKHEVDYLLRVATACSEEARKIEKAKKVFEKVYESKTKNPPVRVGGGIRLARSLTRTAIPTALVFFLTPHCLMICLKAKELRWSRNM